LCSRYCAIARDPAGLQSGFWTGLNLKLEQFKPCNSLKTHIELGGRHFAGWLSRARTPYFPPGSLLSRLSTSLGHQRRAHPGHRISGKSSQGSDCSCPARSRKCNCDQQQRAEPNLSDSICVLYEGYAKPVRMLDLRPMVLLNKLSKGPSLAGSNCCIYTAELMPCT
jgi:hypothetical protein